jgi:hypothetical protein
MKNTKSINNPVKKNTYALGDVVIHEEKQLMGEVVAVANRWVKIRVFNKNGQPRSQRVERYAYHHLRLFMSIETRVDMARKIQEQVKQEKSSLKNRSKQVVAAVKKIFLRKS